MRERFDNRERRYYMLFYKKDDFLRIYTGRYYNIEKIKH
jgi:hypothetical protein